MARRIVFMDDLEEGDVEADAGTITFSLEGTSYEIDLSQRNAAKLRGVLGPFIDHARRAGRAAAPKSTGGSKAGGSGYAPDQLQAIREWARRNGHNVSDKGRIPNDILLAFEQAQTPQEPQKAPTKRPAKKAAASEPAFSGT